MINRRDFLKISVPSFAAALLILPKASVQNPVPIIVISTQTEFDAIMNANIAPGSVIIMQGSFTGNKVSNFAGTPAQPITVIGSNFYLNGSLNVNGAYTHWRNLNIVAPPTHHTFYTARPGTELGYSNLGGGGIGIGWMGSGAGMIHNCTVHDTASYGFYSHNHLGGLRTIFNTTFTNIGGYYAMHFYSDNNRIRDYFVAGCVINKPTIVHSGIEFSNISFMGNTFNSWLKLGNGRTVADVREVVVTGNAFASAGNGITAKDCSQLTITDNSFAVTQLPNLRANIALDTNVNEVRTTIDNNYYVGGDFYRNGAYHMTFAQWQAAGYDANGIYV